MNYVFSLHRKQDNLTDFQRLIEQAGACTRRAARLIDIDREAACRLIAYACGCKRRAERMTMGEVDRG